MKTSEPWLFSLICQIFLLNQFDSRPWESVAPPGEESQIQKNDDPDDAPKIDSLKHGEGYSRFFGK